MSKPAAPDGRQALHTASTQDASSGSTAACTACVRTNTCLQQGTVTCFIAHVVEAVREPRQAACTMLLSSMQPEADSHTSGDTLRTVLCMKRAFEEGDGQHGSASGPLSCTAGTKHSAEMGLPERAAAVKAPPGLMHAVALQNWSQAWAFAHTMTAGPATGSACKQVGGCTSPKAQHIGIDVHCIPHNCLHALRSPSGVEDVGRNHVGPCSSTRGQW